MITIEELFALLCQDIDSVPFEYEDFWTVAERGGR